MSETRPSGYVFRLNDHGQGPELVYQVMLERGWLEFDEDNQDDNDWNLWWRTSRFRNSDYEQLLPWQRVNHYPKTTAITKKDCLARNLKRMRGVYGPAVFNFSPLAFNLPNDYTKFVAEYTKLREKEQGKQIYWICKPADLSRGRGIFLFRDLSELQYDCNAVVQRYISNPMLISGYKFDLRIYVAVSSFHPLCIYVYQEGIVRFSTEKFDLGLLKNVFAHLTNTSINKHSPSYSHDKERVGPGCKWTITQFRHYLHQNHIDDDLLWLRISVIIILTIVTQASQVPKVNNCYELYGFDIIIDENLKPWLLEVNFSPALSSDCETDVIVKKPMLHDFIDMMGFTEEDMDRGGSNNKERKMNRVYGFRSTGRRSSLGKPLRTSQKLPQIPRTNTSSSMSQGSRPATVMELPDSDPPAVRPGCGLPSVQHETMHKEKVESRRLSQNSSSSGSMRRTDSSTSGFSNKVPFNKNLSKASMCSDSGYSGSDSDMVSVTEENGGQQGALSGKGRKPIQRFPRNNPEVTNSVPEVSMPLFNTQATSQYATGIPAIQPETVEDDQPDTGRGTEGNPSSSVTSPLSSPSPSKASTKHRVYGTSYTRRKLGVSYMSNPVLGRASMHSRGSPKGSPQPWKSKPSYSEGRASNPHTPQQRFGDFYLVFPFSEAVRKTAQNSLDTRSVIRECQRLLKSRQPEKRPSKKAHGNHGNSHGSHGNGHSSSKPVMDIETVWSPLRIPAQQPSEQ